MATYYNRYKTAIITDRDQVAAIERLLEVCEASGVEVVDDPSPNQVGGVFFADVYGIHSGDYLGFEEVRRRHTRTELVTVNGWAYESTDDGGAWNPVFDPCDIERDAWNCNGWDYVVTELGDGGRRPIYEISILSEDGMVSVSTGVFTENYDASVIWVDDPEEDEE